MTSKITYLLEELMIIEEDPVGLKVQLRSKISDESENSHSYFEVILFGDGTISIDRYEIDSEQSQRKNTPFSLTYDVFEKIINDIHDCFFN